ncbi:MAG: biosynthetic-type acetolactate synthase large subunit [Synergistetes bacterium]|nr:biosynthetic-type acetolactate synthase large subunit [Synergistota bacterium]MCX8127767.1 biosynthetic-type acetolactate synthase large subunit [Synergistota bacterium]MDW8191317.1 biosynthetic-type acetolactate synthase large subunit [Synergistota bacterium]
MSEERMTGAAAVLRCLELENVRVAFGLPGGAIMPFYDELYKRKSFKHILVRHEQSAAHAADGYARVSKEVGVCIATSGPGSTNLVTGIATAYMDSVPLVAIVGQVATSLVGKDAFQETDIVGITLPIVKHSFKVKKFGDIYFAIRGAFYIAKTGRPGPVLVELPSDVQRQEGVFRGTDLNFRGYNPEGFWNLDKMPEAIEAILNCERPVILAGGGVIISNACTELLNLAEKLEIPVATTLMGKGAFPEEHWLSLGMVGMHGTPAANKALCEADLIVAIGVRFSDRSIGRPDKFANSAKVVHIDYDPAEVGKNVRPNIYLVGDARKIIKEIVDSVGKVDISRRREWLKKIADWKEELRFDLEYSGQVRPQHVLKAVMEITKGEAILTTEVGQNQMWAALYYKVNKPRRFITSGGLGTMGYGLPAAMGACIACGCEMPVFNIAGDGSFMMSVHELDTCARYNLPVKVLLLNNRALGMVRQWQELFFGKRYSETIFSKEPDYEGLARSLGAQGWTVREASQVRGAIERALETPGPVVVNFLIPQEEKVLPMMVPGGTLKDIITEESLERR